MLKIRTIEISPKEARESLLYDGAEAKLKLVSKLYDGAQPQEGEKPLHFWLRCIAEENGLAHTLPCHREIALTVGGDLGLNRFMFFLA